MSFFKSISEVIGSVDLQLNIKKKGDVISVMVTPRGNIKDKAAENIAPLVLSGTPEELDEGFANAVKAPIQKVSGIISNIETFEKGAEHLANENAAAKAQAEKEREEKELRKKRYAAAMRKAEEAERDEEWQKAIKAYSEALEVADNKDEVNKRLVKAKAKESQGSLFSFDEPEELTDPEN